MNYSSQVSKIKIIDDERIQGFHFSIGSDLNGLYILTRWAGGGVASGTKTPSQAADFLWDKRDDCDFLDAFRLLGWLDLKTEFENRGYGDDDRRPDINLIYDRPESNYIQDSHSGALSFVSSEQLVPELLDSLVWDDATAPAANFQIRVRKWLSTLHGDDLILRSRQKYKYRKWQSVVRQQRENEAERWVEEVDVRVPNPRDREDAFWLVRVTRTSVDSDRSTTPRFYKSLSFRGVCSYLTRRHLRIDPYFWKGTDVERFLGTVGRAKKSNEVQHAQQAWSLLDGPIHENPREVQRCICYKKEYADKQSENPLIALIRKKLEASEHKAQTPKTDLNASLESDIEEEEEIEYHIDVSTEELLHLIVSETESRWVRYAALQLCKRRNIPDFSSNACTKICRYLYPSPVGATVSIWANSGEFYFDLHLTARNWSKLLRGDCLDIRGGGTSLEGTFYWVHWSFDSGVLGKFNILCESKEGVKHMIHDCDFSNLNVDEDEPNAEDEPNG